MNYEKIYESLIERGRMRDDDGTYKENHHIIPICVGGTDEDTNLVYLTPEEHYLAHQLLCKISPDNHSLAKAAAMMIAQRPNNKMYGWLRRRHSAAQSACQSGSGNSQHDTQWIFNLTNEENKKIHIADDIPDGWNKGRIMNFANYKEKITRREEEKRVSKQNKIAEARNWYNEYISSDATSIRDFVKNSNYKYSHVSFIKMLKTYVKEFKPEQGKPYIPV